MRGERRAQVVEPGHERRDPRLAELRAQLGHGRRVPAAVGDGAREPVGLAQPEVHRAQRRGEPDVHLADQLVTCRGVVGRAQLRAHGGDVRQRQPRLGDGIVELGDRDLDLREAELHELQLVEPADAGEVVLVGRRRATAPFGAVEHGDLPSEGERGGDPRVRRRLREAVPGPGAQRLGERRGAFARLVDRRRHGRSLIAAAAARSRSGGGAPASHGLVAAGVGGVPSTG